MKLSSRLILGAALAVPLGFAMVPAASATTPSAAPATAAAVPAPALSGYLQKTSAPISLAPATQVRSTVTCPKGSNVVGGGALLDGTSLSQGLNTSVPVFDGRTWAVRVNNGSDSVARFRVYAICVVGLRDYQLIEGIGVDNPVGTQATAQAFCPSGTVPLGGGGNLTSPETGSYLNSSRPISNGWQATGNNFGENDDFVMPFVVCGQQPAGYRVVAGTPSTLKTNSQGQAAVSCPAATSVLGGGGQSSATSRFVSLNSSSPTSNQIWQVFENNLAHTTSTLTAYAVCATTT